MATLYFDIQTIPTQNQSVIDQLTRSIKPPANYSQPDSIAKWYRENLKSEAEKKYRQTALDGLFGEVVSIAWAIDDAEATVFWRDESAGERGLLQNFMAELASPEDRQGRRLTIHRWVGHYISGFDLRFLWQRCVVNGVRPTLSIPLDAKPWDDRVFDTKLAWSGGGAHAGQAGLDAMALAFDLPNRAGGGAQVYDHWLAGRYREIAEYNRQAVGNARELYRRMRFIAAPEAVS